MAEFGDVSNEQTAGQTDSMEPHNSEAAMLTKQSVLETIQKLPDTATWPDMTDALLRLAANEGALSDFARFYRQQLTADNIMEYLDPSKFDVDLGDVIKELEQRRAARRAS
jgi:hypothetical protein